MSNIEISRALLEVNRALSKVSKMIDTIDYEEAGIKRVDDAMTKAYQSIWAAGDGINEARHQLTNVYRKVN